MFVIAFRRMKSIHFPPWYVGGAGVRLPVGFCFVKDLSPLAPYKFMAFDLFYKIFKTNIAEYGGSEEHVVIRCKKQTFHLFAQ